MRPRLPLISAVLAATLLIGQWLCAAHESDHALQAGAAQGCVVCVYAHGAGTGAVPTLPALVLGGTSEVPEMTAAANPLAATLRHHPIRGPPALLV